MVDPRVIPRAEHPISRRDIDPDALKVLYRLRQFDHIAYLVGGSVRDLLLSRRPKDFDIGTSAHPYQVKRLFRNCWIIGRRFRLAHVKFGTKVIEVATFRRQVEPGEEIVQDGVPAPDPTTPEGSDLIHHDNTFGTPEQDAFRRDFTINALFYDIATFSIIDYVGGLDDLRAGVVRSIGDPEVRFREDPVRMLRAVALAARLDFTLDPPIVEAIRLLRHEIARSSAPRLLEEYYKILRGGSAEKTFRGLAAAGLLEPISTELHHGAADPLWRALARLDAYRHQFQAMPDTMTNAVLVGSLLVPLGVSLHPGHPGDPGHPGRDAGRPRDRPPHHRRDADRSDREEEDDLTAASDLDTDARRARRRPPLPRLGELPLARRDIERLRQVVSLQRRLKDLEANPRAQRALSRRSIFREALTWLEIQGGPTELLDHWKALAAEAGAPDPDVVEPAATEVGPFKRRRRRRRRRRVHPTPDR